jgi:hypothetical protein
MFASSRYLCLELLCTHGTPVKKNLSYLPAFPIVISSSVSFLDFHFQDCDRDNLFAALEHPDRVRVIDLNVMYSLFEAFEELSVLLQEPFPSLIHLRLESQTDEAIPALPDTFLAGSAPLLQTLYLGGIPFPAAPALLLSAHDLVELDLHDIESAGYIPPGAMVASLAALPRLKDLTFGFELGMFYPDRILPPVPPITRTVLPALTRFSFEGLLKYFEVLVAQIDAPQLSFLQIEYQDRRDFQIPQLCKFIDRSERLKLSQLKRALSHLEFDAVAIHLFHRDQSSFDLSIQEDMIGQVVNQISAMRLSNVDRLSIKQTYKRPVGHDAQWLELFRPFTAVEALNVDGPPSWQILLALKDVTGERAAEVLPALEWLCLEGEPVASLEAFLAARQNVGRPVTFFNDTAEFHSR